MATYNQKQQQQEHAGEPSDADHRRKLREILDDARAVMMVTRARSGELHSRPMSVARVDDDGTMYFTTSIESPKIEDLRVDPRLDVFFQGKTLYATVAGTARVVQDRALIDELWSESWKLWFPDGKDDPAIAIIVVEPTRGEYWDQSGIKGLSFLYRSVKAYVTGTVVEPKPEDHGKVRM